MEPPSGTRSAETRGELLAAAWELFARHGYDGTTVAAILERTGRSKGAFYHHFRSKEEILDAVVQSMVDQIVAAITVADTPAADAVERLNRFLAASRTWKLGHVEVLRALCEVLYRDENLIIRRKMEDRITELAGPILTDIIARGVDEGGFDVADPAGTAELIFALSHGLGERQAAELVCAAANPEALAVAHRRLELFLTAVERILGAAPGCLERGGHDVVEAVISAHP